MAKTEGKTKRLIDGKGLRTAKKKPPKPVVSAERIAEAMGSKRFLAIVLFCGIFALFRAVNMYSVYSELLRRIRDALPVYSGAEMIEFAEMTTKLIRISEITAGICCTVECVLPLAAAAAFAAVHFDARRGRLADGTGIPLLRVTLAAQLVVGIASAVIVCLLIFCASGLEKNIIVFRKGVLGIIATPPPVFTPMRIAAITITFGGINAALCTLEGFLYRMFGTVRRRLSGTADAEYAGIRLDRAEYLLFGLGLAAAACAVVLLTAVIIVGVRHPSIYKSGIINAFNPPSFAAAACALFSAMKLCRDCGKAETEQQSANCGESDEKCA